MMKARAVSPLTDGSPEKGRENMEAIWKLAAEGKTRPYIHAYVPLRETRSALDMLVNREVIGKVIIEPDQA